MVSLAALKVWTASAIAAAGSGSAVACQTAAGAWAGAATSAGPLASGCLQGGKTWVCSAGDAAGNLVKGLASGIADANKEVMVSFWRRFPSSFFDIVFMNFTFKNHSPLNSNSIFRHLKSFHRATVFA
jgi:hypothetical protein